MAAVLLISFLVLMIIGVPISFSMGLSTLLAIVYEGIPIEVFPQRAFSGIDSFPMMAIPFFILAADLMTSGKLTDLLVDFANALVGHIRGGLGHVNVLVSVFFAGISGSALADAAGTGAIEMDMMVRAGYDRYYAGAMTAASAVIGPIIPPSIIMVMYALTEGRTSVIGLFLAGIVPGLLFAVALMIANRSAQARRGAGVQGLRRAEHQWRDQGRDLPGRLARRRRTRPGAAEAQLDPAGRGARRPDFLGLPAAGRLQPAVRL